MGVIFSNIINWYLSHISYWTIFFLMTIESSFIPFPSEIVIPPAAYKAASGDLNIYMVVLVGTLGALAGALFNYYFAKWLGRRLLLKFANTRLANLMLINQESIEKSELYFRNHGKSSTLIGRLVPGIRQLISIPAGISEMKLSDFILYTIIGSTIWNVILALLGYFFYSQKEILHQYYSELSIVCLVLGLLYVAYLVYKGFKRKGQAA